MDVSDGGLGHTDPGSDPSGRPADILRSYFLTVLIYFSLSLPREDQTGWVTLLLLSPLRVLSDLSLSVLVPLIQYYTLIRHSPTGNVRIIRFNLHFVHLKDKSYEI